VSLFPAIGKPSVDVVYRPRGKIHQQLHEVVLRIHFGDLPAAQEALWEMLARKAVELVPLGLGDLPRICELLRKYADRPSALDSGPTPYIDREGLALPEILAEKTRACYQRNKARDIYDLGIYANRPLDQPLIRRLVVLKLWQARDTFDPARLMTKFEHGAEFDWDDLSDLVRRGARIDRERICADCVRGFRFLAGLTPEERTLANDPHQREHALWERLRSARAGG
jgi:hypothetical protein